MPDGAHPHVLFAMPRERRPFIDRCRVAGLVVMGDRVIGGDGRLLARAVTIGVGPLSAAEGLARLDPGDVSEVIHVGIAGAVRELPDPQEIRRVAEVRYSGPDRCQTWALGDPGPLGARFDALPPARIETLDGPAGVMLKARTRLAGWADLIDMETFPVAFWCAENGGIGYRGLRAVSDGPDDELPAALMRAWDGRCFRLPGLILRAVFDGALRRRLRALGDASDRAAQALAEVLVQALAI